MVGEKKIEKTKEGTETGLKSVPFSNLAEQDVISSQDSGKDGSPSGSTSSISSSGDASFTVKGETVQEPVANQVIYYPPTSCYGYYYTGYDGAYPKWIDGGYFNAGDGSEMPYPGMQSVNGSLVYHMPGYNPYASGFLMGVGGKCVGQQPYIPSSGCFQPPVPYGPDAVPPNSLDSTVVGEALNGTAGPNPKASASGPTAAVKSKDLNSIKTNGAVDAKVSALPLDSKLRLSTASSNFSKLALQSQHLKPLNKVPQMGCNFQSAGSGKGYYPVRKFTSFSNQGQGLFPCNGPMNYRSSGQTRSASDRFNFRDKFNKNREFGASSELNRGPRAQKVSTPLASTVEKDRLGTTIRRDRYNLQGFNTEYENAKFFVIKSYSEDDIHKSIKYDVWASTPNGNKKLDAAFHDAETRSSEAGTSCPIFLFFSVNGSGQFVGLAEMIGKVDFKKNMDFWQMDKWNGFFPLNWHIIKDIPNNQLWHIILENNDGKSVTNSRDTQEIGFNQGSEMLTIFKSYPAKTSMLDDFNFYEEREKSLHARKSSKPSSSPQMEIHGNNDFSRKPLEGFRKVEPALVRVRRTSDTKASLITLTKNLSLHSQLPKRSAAKDSSKESTASVTTTSYRS